MAHRFMTHRFSFNSSMLRWGILLLLTVTIGVIPLTISHAQQSSGTLKQNTAFQVALIGDLPYSPQEEQEFTNLVTDVNGSDVAFVVHDGDIKSGAAPCTDALFLSRRSLFETFKKPFVLVPGDNEWTDCHRAGDDPLERLKKLRELFFATETSLGQPTLLLERQSKTPKFADYRENVRWQRGPVLFVGLHIVGSNNNLGRTPDMDREFQARNQANLAWLKSSFALARDQKLGGVMLIIQANPWFEHKPEQRKGFNDFLTELQAEVAQFGKPVVLVHGDSHQFQINKPLYGSTGERLMNFTRLETFGTPDIHWVKATIDPNDPQLFRFDLMLVKANLKSAS
jgi:hypothetical protein